MFSVTFWILFSGTNKFGVYGRTKFSCKLTKFTCFRLRFGFYLAVQTNLVCMGVQSLAVNLQSLRVFGYVLDLFSGTNKFGTFSRHASTELQLPRRAYYW